VYTGARAEQNAKPTFPGECTMTAELSPPRKMFGDFAPKFVELTEDVLFGDVWERPGLSKRDRSLITIAALVALNRTEQARFHLERGFDNGLTKEEIVETITHLAFYSGWPNSVNAMLLAKEIVTQRGGT
jgi:4-carboxymuconolactone decarboxylase